MIMLMDVRLLDSGELVCGFMVCDMWWFFISV